MITGSAGADGSITFKFLTKHANWENGTPYAHLVKAMEKMSTGCEVRMVEYDYEFPSPLSESGTEWMYAVPMAQNGSGRRK